MYPHLVAAHYEYNVNLLADEQLHLNSWGLTAFLQGVCKAVAEQR